MRPTQEAPFTIGTSTVTEDSEYTEHSSLSPTASSVAHELSIPLAAIVASAQSVLAFSASGRQSDGVSSAFKEELDLIVSEARRVAKLTEKLLTVARLPSKRSPVQDQRSGPRSRPTLVAADQTPDLDSQPTVLLVDDEPAIRRSVGRYLRRSGYDVDVATTGHDAANSLRERNYDAIVSDLRMPELSGEELFELLTQEFPDMTSRVVFASGDLMRKETQSFVKQSGCPALRKPYDLPDLLEVVALLCSCDKGNDAS